MTDSVEESFAHVVGRRWMRENGRVTASCVQVSPMLRPRQDEQTLLLIQLIVSTQSSEAEL